MREGACIGAVMMIQPWTLRLILNAVALAAASPTLRWHSSGSEVRFGLSVGL